MMHLNELIERRDIIINLNSRSRVTDDESKALETAAQMLSALITQLDSQSISFTP